MIIISSSAYIEYQWKKDTTTDVHSVQGKVDYEPGYLYGYVKVCWDYGAC